MRRGTPADRADGFRGNGGLSTGITQSRSGEDVFAERPPGCSGSPPSVPRHGVSGLLPAVTSPGGRVF